MYIQIHIYKATRKRKGEGKKQIKKGKRTRKRKSGKRKKGRKKKEISFWKLWIEILPVPIRFLGKGGITHDLNCYHRN